MTSGDQERTPSHPAGPEQSMTGQSMTGQPSTEPDAATVPSRRRVDLGRLRRGDAAVAAGTLLYLVLLVLPWFSTDAFDLGWGYRVPALSANGFDSGLLTAAFVLLLAAAAWALLPAVAGVPVGWSRSVGTVLLVVLAVLLTVVQWLTTFDIGVSVVGLLAVLCVVAVLVVVVLQLVSDLGATAALPRPLRAVAGWTDRPVRRRVVAEERTASPQRP